MLCKINKPNACAMPRELLGPDLITVILTMASADRRQRILERHSGDVASADLFDVKR